MITHTNDSYQIPSQNKTKSKLHILKNAKIQCVNMKWILLVLWKSQSGHDSVHRRTDGRADVRSPPHVLTGCKLVPKEYSSHSRMIYLHTACNPYVGALTVLERIFRPIKTFYFASHFIMNNFSWRRTTEKLRDVRGHCSPLIWTAAH